MGNVLIFPVMADLTNRVFELRRARKLSQEQLANLAGCSKMHISGIERGLRELSLTMMRKIADALDVSAADLLTDIDNPHRLKNDEAHLVDTYRAADPVKQDDILRVAEALAPQSASASQAA